MEPSSPSIIAELLSQIAPFSQLAKGKLEQIAGECRLTQFESGETIISANRLPASIYIVLEGTVNAVDTMGDPNDSDNLSVVPQGGCVGWISVISKQPREQVISATASVCIAWSASKFVERVPRDRVLNQAFLSNPSPVEVRDAVVSELRRIGKPLDEARLLADAMLSESVVREWPRDEIEIAAASGRLWVVSGGEGVEPGSRWEKPPEEAVSARLIGLPATYFVLEQSASAWENASLTLLPGCESSPPPVPTTIPRNTERPSNTSPHIATREQPSESVTRSKQPNHLLRIAALLAILATAGTVLWAGLTPADAHLQGSGRLSFTGKERPILAERSGTVDEVLTKEGRFVKRGQPLLRIIPPSDQNQIPALERTLEELKAEIAYCKNVLEDKPALSSTIKPSRLPELLKLVGDRSSINKLMPLQRALAAGTDAGISLSPEDKLRFNTLMTRAANERQDQRDSIRDDVSALNEDLNEARNELRDVESEVAELLSAYNEAAAQAAAAKKGPFDFGEKNAREAEAANARSAYQKGKARLAQRKDAVTKLQNRIRSPAVNAPMKALADNPYRDGANRELDILRQRMVENDERFKLWIERTGKDIADTEVQLQKLRSGPVPEEIVAPFDGVIIALSKDLEPGGKLRSSDDVGRMLEGGEMILEALFENPVDGSVRVGGAVELFQSGGQDRRILSGRITQVRNEVGSSGNARVFAQIKIEQCPPDLAAGMEMRATVHFTKGTVLTALFDRAGGVASK
jgi:multidrug efflux pump subunit AcrA (membrane-fusion protein)